MINCEHLLVARRLFGRDSLLEALVGKTFVVETLVDKTLVVSALVGIIVRGACS